MGDGKPIFRIDELIEALLKGSPADPVYLQVGSKKYGIDKIETGVIRVKSGKKTQDAETVVQTLRRFATGAPKEEETGVAWRIVGVGGGTAIRSVKYEGGKIIVRTLANEGKGRAAESQSFAAPLVCPGCSADLIQVHEYSVTVCKDCGRQLTEQDYYNQEHWGETPPLKQDELDAESFGAEEIPEGDCDHITTDASGTCLHCCMTAAEQRNERMDEPDRGSAKCVCGVNCVCEVKNPHYVKGSGGTPHIGDCDVCGSKGSLLEDTRILHIVTCDNCGAFNEEIYDAESDDSPTYTPEAYDPLTESPTDYDPKAKTFAAASKKKSKRRKKSDRRRAATPAKRAWNTKVSTKISTIMAEYDKTGKIGNSRPKNKAAAMKQAIAVAYSIAAREYKTSGKRLPAGVRYAEGEKSRPFR